MWKTVKLGQMLDVQNGYAFDSKKFNVDGEIPLIRIRDLKQGSLTETRYTGDYDKKYVVTKGNLLIGMDGEFRCYEWKGRDALLNQRVCRLQNFDDNLDQRYLLYAINDELKKIEDVTGFTTVKHLSSSTIKEIILNLPPLTEQQRIVAKLDAAFAEIDRAIEVAEGKEAEIKKLTTSLLSVMLNANEHVNVKLGDVAKAVGGNGFPTKFQGAMSKEIPFFKVSDMNTGGNDIYMFTSNNYVDLCALKQMKAKAHPKGTIIFPKIGGAISTNKKRILASTAAFDNNVMGVIPSDNILSEYLYKIFLSLDLYELSNKAALPSITNTTVENIEIPLPSKRVQASIVARLDKANDAVEVVSNAVLKSKENLAALKSAILAQELQPRL